MPDALAFDNIRVDLGPRSGRVNGMPKRIRVLTEEQKARAAQRAREHRSENPEKSRAAGRRYYRKLHPHPRPMGRKPTYNEPFWKRNPDVAAAQTAARRAAKKQATPSWANQNEIKAMYRHAALLRLETGSEYHVDHIVPLQSPIVCGLHWEGNLQVLLGTENRKKQNSYWPDMP